MSAVSVGVSVVVLNLAHKIWGEQAPTYLGVERPRQVAERLAPILYWWSQIMGPVIRLGDGAAKWTLGLFGVEITRSWADDDGGGASTDRVTLRQQMADLLDGGSLPRDRRSEVLASLEIDDVPCRDVMVPVHEVVALAMDVPGRENLARIGRGGHTRYPVLRKDGVQGAPLALDDLAGMIYLPALFACPERLAEGDLGLSDVLEDPVVSPPNLSVAELIDRLQDAGQEIAVVCDGAAIRGFVTITDALEVITGEVEDPVDRRGA